MKNIKINVFHTGEICVSKELPFGGEDCNKIKAAGITAKKEDRLWLPVSAYLIECQHGKILVDCGWHRNMSPKGEFDKIAQIKSLGSVLLYKVNQGVLPKGMAINEQLLEMGIEDKDIDLVLLTHLDCDHVSGLELVKNAKKILVSNDEIEFAKKKIGANLIRYHSKWWKGIDMTGFDWDGTEGPVKKSYDVFGDGSIVMVNIPGHSDGQCAVKIKNDEGKYVLLFADGGYGKKSWHEYVMSGGSADKKLQKKSLDWIRQESMHYNCIESLANHDITIKPHIINF